jgi:hypothetical protein
MVDLTDSLVALSDFLFNLVEDNKVPLGIIDTFYGEQMKYPHTPAVSIETDNKAREIDGAPRRTLNTLTGYIIVYHSPVSDVQKTRRDVDLMAEAIEKLVHADSTMGGLVIHSLVTEIQSGYQNRPGTQYRSSRLTVVATTQSQLPLARRPI